MSSWFYGLVRQKDGKVRIWEICEVEDRKGKIKYLWGSPGVVSWMIKEIGLVIRDLWIQKKKVGSLFDENKLNVGLEKQLNEWKKELKKNKFVSVDKLI